MDNSHTKRLEHMKRRKGHGLTYRELEDDFGTSKSKIHRDITEKSQKNQAED